MKTIKLTKYHIFDKDDLEWLESDCNISEEDVPNIQVGEVDTDYDYAQTALVDEITCKIIESNDNIHGDPELYISAFLVGVQHSGDCKIDFNEKYIMKDDFNKKYLL